MEESVVHTGGDAGEKTHGFLDNRIGDRIKDAVSLPFPVYHPGHLKLFELLGNRTLFFPGFLHEFVDTESAPTYEPTEQLQSHRVCKVSDKVPHQCTFLRVGHLGGESVETLFLHRHKATIFEFLDSSSVFVFEGFTMYATSWKRLGLENG